MAYGSTGGAVADRSWPDDWTAIPASSILLAAIPVGIALPRQPAPRCPEIDCVRHLLPSSVIAFAELRSSEVGVGADRVLIAEGFIGEEVFLAAFAEWFAIAFEPLDGRSRLACPASDDQLIQSTITGLLPLISDAELYIVVAPRLVDSRRLIEIVRSRRDIKRRIRITSVSRLQQFVARHATRTIEQRAADSLRTERPELCAATRRSRRLLWTAAMAVLLVTVAFPSAVLAAIELLLAFVFLAWIALRLFGVSSEPIARRRPPMPVDDWLPTYTIIVPLYREAAALPGLMKAMERIRYPREKLDLKLVIEGDDHQTQAGIALLPPSLPFEVVIAPPRGPRTKPKALNAALQFARGSLVAIYDAEDRPDPDQLRIALEAFVAGDAKLACVQARLTIDNTADSCLARMFTAEYAGLFDVFLPGLSARHLPLPLGGSSNHFRTAILRTVGAWDPYNVTEDADLGMRLARAGYRSEVIGSTTYEEAPAQFGPWLKQRTRWFKGWMQTWLVHMRSPLRLLHELGWAGFTVLQLLVGGTVLAALVHPLFVAALVWDFAAADADTFDGGLAAIYVSILLLGYVVSAGLGIAGLARRRLLGSAWALLLTPVYWLLLSWAAWRALYQLLRDPYRWEKTEHGLARTSRLAKGAGVRDSAADRLPPRPAAASC